MKVSFLHLKVLLHEKKTYISTSCSYLLTESIPYHTQIFISKLVDPTRSCTLTVTLGNWCVQPPLLTILSPENSQLTGQAKALSPLWYVYFSFQLTEEILKSSMLFQSQD